MSSALRAGRLSSVGVKARRGAASGEIVTVITCPACAKQNQDHYRFCLGCGAELPRGKPSQPEASDATAAPPVVDEGTSTGPDPEPGAEPVPAAEPVTAAAESPPAAEGGGLPPGKCPECDYVNPPTNRFCASCGFRIDEVQKAAAPAAVDTDEAQAILVALDPEGNEVGRHTLVLGEHVLGREAGGIFAADAYLSPRHARFNFDGRILKVDDLGSLNGVFRKLVGDQDAPIKSGQRFRIGQELLQFDALEPEKPDDKGVAPQGTAVDGVIGRLSLVVGRGTAQPSVPVTDRGVNMGRERGDLLFPEDGYVSGLHCMLIYDDGDVFVRDLGSSNGTFVQLVKETDLRNGDVLLMGQQLYRVTI